MSLFSSTHNPNCNLSYNTLPCITNTPLALYTHNRNHTHKKKHPFLSNTKKYTFPPKLQPPTPHPIISPIFSYHYWLTNARPWPASALVRVPVGVRRGADDGGQRGKAELQAAMGLHPRHGREAAANLAERDVSVTAMENVCCF